MKGWPADRSQKVLAKSVSRRSLWRGYGRQPSAKVGGDAIPDFFLWRCEYIKP